MCTCNKSDGGLSVGHSFNRPGGNAMNGMDFRGPNPGVKAGWNGSNT